VQGVGVAVDCDNPRAAFGEQVDGRASDDSGRTGDNGNPAVEANSIGHWHFPRSSLPGCSGLWQVAALARFDGGDYFICDRG
jgi:hypothetical protein